MSVVLTLVFNGLANSALYFLMAAGLSLIFGLLRVINFAHGAFFIWGAYVATWLYSVSHSFPLAAGVGIITAALLGFLSERVLIRHVYGDPTQQLLITMGILMVLTELVQLPFGRNPVSSLTPPLLRHSYVWHHFVLVEFQLFTILVGLVVYILLLLLLQKTRLGVIVRAGVSNADLVQARGIPIRRYFTLIFTLGAALAGLGGVLSGPYFGSLSPDAGMSMQLTAFIIVVLGGLGSLKGSMAGSLLIGLATAFVSYYAPSLAAISSVLVMAMILMWRPEGLFGKKEMVW
jgi:branched-chain amino acid transport system permease protein